MFIYVKKIVNHDITHQISLKKEIVKDFFEDMTNFDLKGLTTNQVVNVRLFTATDPRFSIELRNLLKIELNAKYDINTDIQINDIFLIEKNNNEYILDIFRLNGDDENDKKYKILKDLIETFDNTRHEKRAVLITIDSTDNFFQNDKVGENLILYGVPGCGKSYYIDNEICKDIDEIQKIRVVFHQDYLYTDFIGQILPSVDDSGSVNYKFKPGAFTKILKNALQDTSKHYYLIIEEINRGNAPAIFGDIFQLLDRENGQSKYTINNEDIAKEIYGDKDKEIFIPSNLSLIATMNTADQNVFVLDTAFQRRWKMQMIPNEIEKASEEKIANTDVTWKKFVKEINEFISSSLNKTITNEDKRLGAFFIKDDEIKDPKSFAYKVIKYLWDDVFKFDKDKLFLNSYNNLDEVIEEFIGSQSDNKFDIFVDDFKNKLNSDE